MPGYRQQRLLYSLSCILCSTLCFFFFLMIRRPPRSTHCISSAASDVYKRQVSTQSTWGNLVTSVIVAASLAVIGWQGWNWYQGGQAAKASAIYGVLEQAAAGGDVQKVKAAAGELAEKFGGTNYASLGAMLAAKQSFEAGDLKERLMNKSKLIKIKTTNSCLLYTSPSPRDQA
eukprot:TRINITY_DN28557_c0_g1_i1.p1 TRINITY_DN28557_c0_g1~~TRINITY_DN28557_c0_g1_i1.p1  ORF type:complete len:174 (-),score=46.20 TRINITY_DN28557_c0_g1_i1:122-643(-)